MKKLRYRTVTSIEQAERLLRYGWRIVRSSPFREYYLMEYRQKKGEGNAVHQGKQRTHP